MESRLDIRRIVIYIGFAFGLAWLLSLIIYLTGGLTNSPALIPGTPYTLALVLTAVGVMWAPALANIFTRLITREGRQNLWLQPRFKRGWLFWVIAWFGPGLLTIVGGAIFYLLYPQYFDPTLSTLRQMFEASGQGPLLESGSAVLWTAVLVQTVTGLLIAPVVNSLFTFGEEFGWRGYLLHKLMPLGWRPAVLVSGVIWGVWHWPIIAMGHNYGLEYAGYPWVGMFAMVWFTIILGVFLSWVTLKARSVWPAVIGHAAINGITALPALFLVGQPHPAIGPLATGIVGSIAWTLAAAWLFWKPGVLSAPAETPVTTSLEAEAVGEN